MDIFQGRISLKHKTIAILYSSQRSGLPGMYLHLFYIQKLRLSPFGSLWYILVKLSKQILINIPRGLILNSSYLNLDCSVWATKKVLLFVLCRNGKAERGGSQDCSGDRIALGTSSTKVSAGKMGTTTQKWLNLHQILQPLNEQPSW